MTLSHLSSQNPCQLLVICGYNTGLYDLVWFLLDCYHISRPIVGTIGNPYQPTNLMIMWSAKVSQCFTPEAAEEKKKKLQVGVDEVEWFYDEVPFEEIDNLKNNDEDQLVGSGLFKPMNGSWSREETAHTCIP